MLHPVWIVEVLVLLAVVPMPTLALDKPLSPINSLSSPNIPEGQKEPKFWNDMAEKAIKDRLKMRINENVAKNVILFIGDGMGPSTVTAGRILRGQLNDLPGEDTVLNWERFPNVAKSKTYNVDRQTPDSAGTATAILSGVKANFYQVGLNAKVPTGECEASLNNQVTTILDWTMAAGRSTGIVTTARISHATPAAAYAHASDRYWEGDVDTKTVVDKGCIDISRQLIEDNPDIDVLFGGGRRTFHTNTTLDPEYGTKGRREDGRDLIQMWKDDKVRKNATHKYVWNKNGFDTVDPNYTDYVLGLFEPNHMQYEVDRNKSGEKGEPSLAEMTRKAIKILQRKQNGYFLLVEGARIDHGHHDSLPIKALHEVLTMEDAVQEALGLTDESDTLIIVTADHSIPMDIQGYAYRGSDLFGEVQPIDPTELTEDQKPYSVLMYANGPGYESPRRNFTMEEMHDKDFTYPSAVPVPWTTHDGEDVTIYAQGPMSHLIHGTQEQNYIGHVMAYASCVGRYLGKCERSDEHYMPTGAAPPLGATSALLLLCLLLSYLRH